MLIKMPCSHSREHGGFLFLIWAAQSTNANSPGVTPKAESVTAFNIIILIRNCSVNKNVSQRALRLRLTPEA